MIGSYLRHELRETSNRVDDSTASIFEARETVPQPSYPYDQECQGDSGDNFREEPKHGCELEFGDARQGNNTVRDSSIASGADHTRAFSSWEDP